MAEYSKEKKKRSLITEIKVGYAKNKESYWIIIGAILYTVLFLLLDLIILGNVKDPVDEEGVLILAKRNICEMVGLVLFFKFLVACVFFFMGTKLRRIDFENKGWAKWLVIIGLFAVFIQIFAMVSYSWALVVSLIPTIAEVVFGIYIMVHYRHEVKNY